MKIRIISFLIIGFFISTGFHVSAQSVTCKEGKGIDPNRASMGCMDCQYLPSALQSSLATCKNLPKDTYRWWQGKRVTVLDTGVPNCGSTPVEYATCPVPNARCQMGPAVGDAIFTCTKNGEHPAMVNSIRYYGKVVDEAGNPLSGVKVTFLLSVFNTLSSTTTDAQGKYIGFGTVGVQSFAAYVKDGYIIVSGPNKKELRPGEQDDAVMAKVAAGATNGIGSQAGTSGGTQSGTQGGTQGGTSVATGKDLAITPAVGTMNITNKNSVVFTLLNVESGNLEACYEVVSQPNAPELATVSANRCSTPSNFGLFNGNREWVLRGTTLTGTFPYNEIIWGVPGIRVKTFFRKKSDPSKVVTATLTTTETQAPTTSGTPAPQVSIPATSAIRVAVDRASIGQSESFKVTVTGLPPKYFTTGWLAGDLLRFSRVGAPVTSCENSSRSDNCQASVGPACGILGKYMGVSPSQWYADETGKIELVCYMTGNNNNVNGAGNVSATDQTYVVKVVARSSSPNANGSFPAPTVSVNTASFIVRANGTTVGMTNYGDCEEGQGMNPFEVYKGCADCQYLPADRSASISTCQNMPVDTYRWWKGYRITVLDKGVPNCVGAPVDNDVCPTPNARCQMGPAVGDAIYTCTKNGESPALGVKISGVVVDEAGNQLAGVKVRLVYVGFGMQDLGTTGSDGAYSASLVEMGLNPYIDFFKDGYVTNSINLKAGRQDVLVMKKVAAGNISTGTTPNPASKPAAVTPPASPIAIDQAVATLDMNSLIPIKITLTNVKAGDLEACVEVLAQPNAPSAVNPGNCDSPNNYAPFNGNADWKFDTTDPTMLVGTFGKDTAYLDGDGIVVRSYFRKISDKTRTVSTTITVQKKVDLTSSSSGGVGGAAAAVLDSAADLTAGFIESIWTLIKKF